MDPFKDFLFFRFAHSNSLLGIRIVAYPLAQIFLFMEYVVVQLSKEILLARQWSDNCSGLICIVEVAKLESCCDIQCCQSLLLICTCWHSFCLCDQLIPSFVSCLKQIQMNMTAELSWIFSNLPVFPLVCARHGYLFILPCWFNVYWSGCHPNEFSLCCFQPEPLCRAMGGARPCRNHNCPLVKRQLLDHPLLPRVCASIPCAHLVVRACLQICMFHIYL